MKPEIRYRGSVLKDRSLICPMGFLARQLKPPCPQNHLAGHFGLWYISITPTLFHRRCNFHIGLAGQNIYQVVCLKTVTINLPTT